MLSYRGLSGSSWQGACYVHKDFSHQHIACLHSVITKPSWYRTKKKRTKTWKSCLKNHDLGSVGKNIPTKLTSKFCYPALLGFMSRPTEWVVGICYTSIHFITDFDTLILLGNVAQWVESSAYMWIFQETGNYRRLWPDIGNLKRCFLLWNWLEINLMTDPWKVNNWILLLFYLRLLGLWNYVDVHSREARRSLVLNDVYIFIHFRRVSDMYF